MYVTLMLSIRYVYHYIMYDYTFVWVSARAEKTQDETRAPYAHLVVVFFRGDQAQYTKQYGFYRRNFDYSKNITRCGTTAVNTIHEYACEYSFALLPYSVFFCLLALFSLAKFA